MTKQEIELQDEILKNQIYLIRGQKVMLDRTLAELYEVTTSNLNKAVKRNLKRFPDDFMFKLSTMEFKELMFQNGISSWGGTRKEPYAFTEQGIAMLSGLLNSDRAISVNIQIMRIFTKMRQLLSDHTQLHVEMAQFKLILDKVIKKQDGHDKNIELLFTYIDRLQEQTIDDSSSERKTIGYKLKNS